jgi:translocation and assembly module TamB
LRVEPGRAAINGLRLSATAIPSAGAAEPMRVSGRIETVALSGNDLELRGIRLAALGGSLSGHAEIANFDRFRFEGNLSGFGMRRLVAALSPQPLPWDAQISGPVRAEGSLRRPGELRASARLNLSPAAGAPVRGQIQLDYDGRRGTLDLGRSSLQLPSTRLDISGAIGNRMVVHLETRDLGDLLPLVGRPIPLELRQGVVVFDGTITGRLEDPRIHGTLSATNFVYAGRQLDTFRAEIVAGRSGARLENAVLARDTLQARLAASIGMRNWRVVDSSALSANLAVRDAALTDLLALAGQPQVPATGTVSAAAQVGGTAGDPRIDVDLLVSKGSVYQEPFDRISAKLRYAGGRAELAGAQLAAGDRRIDLAASYAHAPGNFLDGLLRFEVNSNRMQLAEFETVRRKRPGVQGVLRLAATGAIDLDRTGAGRTQYRIEDLQANVLAEELQMGDQPLGNAHLLAATQGDVLTARVASDFAGSVIRGDGEWKLAGNYPGTLRVNFTRIDFRRLQEWISPPAATGWRMAGVAEGTLEVSGPALEPELWKGSLRLPKLEVGPVPGAALAVNGDVFTLRNSGPIVVTMERGTVRVESARLVGRSTDLRVTGTVAYQQKNALDLRVNGRVDLAVVEDFNPDFSASGLLITDATVRGTLGQPLVNGRMELQSAAFNVGDFPTGIYNASGVILFSGNRANIQELTGESGGGKVRVAGFVGYSERETVFRIEAEAEQVRVRYPPGTSTVADASINLTGTSASSMLSGTVTIVRTGFNPRSDFSSILARSAEPVRTPAQRTGLLANMHFDVQIVTAPDIMFQSPLAQGIQADANLRLRGTATNPALLGRVNITQGQIVFFGTKYNISQGSIAFYNPVRIEPILNIDLETKARGIDVTLNVSGPLTKLNLTPRSDPPLQFSEIIALLATGRAPTSDPTLLAQESTSPQSWQQMGASALLGQAIANPVAGRLQRFFGVTKLKIDPSLTGVENNPQARLTLEQQVTPEITFTYITNVTSSNPLVIRVEWAFSPRWSVVAVREESGLFGVDFLFKRHFR